MPYPRKVVAALAACALLGSGFVAPAHAGAVSTDEVVQDAGLRDRIATLLDRADVRDALAKRGVAADQVAARVAALTDAEAGELAARLDELPAGGDVVGVLFSVFVILLVTDILGLTKVFPFTRPIR